ncbi:MAG: restriction endonuclease [Pusillimonas sp.]|jgi:type I restriction enzyme S subunit|nr:restriction endonuclease [Pusillimonas sp.]
MSNLYWVLPASWESVRLGHFVENEKGKKPKRQTAEKTPEYNLPYVDIEAFEEGNIKSWTNGENCRICYESDFLMVWDGSRSGLVGKGMYGALGSTLVRINFPGMNNQYAYYFLLSKYQEINTRTKGSGTPHVDPDLLWNYEFPIPPLNEQKRIVNKIEELFSKLDNGITALKTVREQLKVYRQALLKNAFEGKLTAKWREKNADRLESSEQLLARIQQERETRYQKQLDEWKAAVKAWEVNCKEGKKPGKPKPLKDFGYLQEDILTTLPILPDSWTWKKLGFLTTGVEYGTSAKSSEKGQTPVIRMGNLQNGGIDWSDLVYTSDSEEIKKYSLRKDDVLFNRTNSPELVGKTAKYKGERPALFAGYLIRINQIENIALADYVNYFLNSHIAKQYGNSVKTDGVNQSNINGEKLQNYPFPFCSMEEQSVIVEMLEEKISLTNAAIRDIELQLVKADTLRQSILKKAFSGQLVPQDPNDEPAGELLARIQAEKAAQKATVKPKTQMDFGSKRGHKLRVTS